MSDQVPLSQSIAEIATRDSLNSEQIKRVIETVNQVAYLKLQQEAVDQTFEFPVATMEDVSLHLANKVTPTDLTKVASSNLLDVFEGNCLVKEASEVTHVMSDAERYAAIYKQKLVAESQLEKMAHQERELIVDLHNQIHTCRRDPDILEKIAYLTDDDEDALRSTSKMLTGMVKIATCKQAFYEEDLKEAKSLLGLIKQAYTLQNAKESLSNSVTKADNFLKSTATGIKNQIERSKPMMPNKLALGLTAPFYEPKNSVWGSLQRTAE